MAKYWFKRYAPIAHLSRDSEELDTSNSGGPYSYVSDLWWPADQGLYIHLDADEYGGYQLRYENRYSPVRLSNRPASYSDFIRWYGSYNAKVYTYDITEDKMSAWEYYATFDYNNYSGQVIYRTGKYTLIPVYTRGEYVDEIIGEEGVYPDSGYYAGDGYWYERDRLATQFYARMGGKLIETASYVRVNGIWRKAELGVLSGKSVFSIDDAGNAKAACDTDVGDNGDMNISHIVNVYQNADAEV